MTEPIFQLIYELQCTPLQTDRQICTAVRSAKNFRMVEMCSLIVNVLVRIYMMQLLQLFRLRFFGHLARSAPEEDHHRVIAAALRPPSVWRRPPGRPRSTWLRVIDEDVQPQNFGVHTAWRKAKDRDTGHQVVSAATAATLCQEFATKKKKLLQLRKESLRMIRRWFGEHV